MIVTVGIPEGQVSSRMDYLSGNLSIMASVCEQLKRYAPDSMIINATNPLDIINSMIPSYISISPSRLIGFSLNDSYRFRWAISQVLEVDLNSVVRAIVFDTKKMLPCSVIGSDGISIGRPVILGKNGVEQIAEIDMNGQEYKQWTSAKDKISKIVIGLKGEHKT